ncbi:hypothetical protein M0802_008732 [Mischocyttarus mexicanus]|nr:hypothetical protein M0802_008732 [Mischocyttarus mexicanus]
MAFSLAAFSYILALIIDAFLIFFVIFHVIAFDELQSGQKNPIDQCNSLNPLVLPEYALHVLINFFFLISEQWFTLCLNIPLIAYHVWRYANRPVMTGPGLYDPTSILNAHDLAMFQREGWYDKFTNSMKSTCITLWIIFHLDIKMTLNNSFCANPILVPTWIYPKYKESYFNFVNNKHFLNKIKYYKYRLLFL